jgi:hypothetical protein
MVIPPVGHRHHTGRINLPHGDPVAHALHVTVQASVAAVRLKSRDHSPLTANVHNEPRFEIRLVQPQLHQQAIVHAICG